MRTLKNVTFSLVALGLIVCHLALGQPTTKFGSGLFGYASDIGVERRALQDGISGKSTFTRKSIRIRGGIIFQEVATLPKASDAAGLAVISSTPNGYYSLTFDKKVLLSDIRGWEIHPALALANNGHTSLVSLYLDSELTVPELKYGIQRRSQNKRIFWVSMAPEITDTLVGWHVLLADCLLVGTGKPRGDILQVVEALSSEHPSTRTTSTSQGTDFQIPCQWDHYIVTDLGKNYDYTVVAEKRDSVPAYNFFADPLQTDNDDDIVEDPNCTVSVDALKVVCPEVRRTLISFSRLTAICRAIKRDYPTAWASLREATSSLPKPPEVETPATFELSVPSLN